MKKLLLILLAFTLSVGAFSQKYNDLMTTDLSIVRRVADDVAYNAKTKFVFAKAIFDKFDSTRYSVVYKNNVAPPRDKTMNVQFVKSKSIFVFDRLEGSYEDLFPFWKKYIDPTANADSIKNSLDNVQIISSSHPVHYPKKILVFDEKTKIKYIFTPNIGQWQIQREKVD